MMKQIWKFEVKTTGVLPLKMPKGAIVLTIQEQKGTPCIWAMVDTKEVEEVRYFEIFATGEPIHDNVEIKRQYINTFQLYDGFIVYHLFERIFS